ncbi:MAG: TonB family protein [Bryobacteraceae bacterium]
MPLTLILKATILLAAALGVARVLRCAPAATRHTVYLLALAALTLPASWRIAAAAIPADLASAASGATTSASTVSGPSLWAALRTLWAAGAALVLARLLLGLASAWISRRSTVVDRHPVTVRVANVSSPVTFGILRPEIFLPEASTGWSASQLRMVILHEIAHIHRRDSLSNLIASVACAVCWFHPLVWMLAARLRLEQEIACDESVINGGVAADSYAAFLLELARALTSPLLFGVPMTGAAGELKTRFRALLNPNPRTRSVRPAVLTAVFAAAVLTLSVASNIRAQDEEVYKIGGDVSPPSVLLKFEPDYTQAARDARIEGTVLVSLVVASDGKTRDFRIEPGLDANAIAALKQWRFKPAEKSGKPVAVRATLSIQFRLL